MPTTEIAEEVQQKTQILIDQTKEYHAVLFEIQGLLRPEGQSCAAQRNGLLFCPTTYSGQPSIKNPIQGIQMDWPICRSESTVQ